MDTLVRALIDTLDDSYLEVFRKILRNANMKEDEINSTIENCLTNNIFYNAKTRKMVSMEENTIINPVNLDIEILKTISDIIVRLVNTSIVISKGVNRQEEQHRYL